ncbi:hypothetical protein SD70_24645 [Gordoniibacillus kamchatkensis]|uniref:Glycosyltransferase 2-like domain-containing protein n=1 Tax=Gordoniibacillus kamchatkensis TaxID=1590651 RepID=A0ABR5ACM3_9BACL|nr:glycosyltransferase family 2 protein [Paenibacillus sp. VKM B-2647]KIL38721.1 hypothetical protein SD70_24645 [Paenibacillus sp. VKM B-2647]
MDKAAVDILLSTFNGEKYLPDLLQSLEAQTFREWKLIIRDDGSTDETISILQKFKNNSGRSVEIIESDANLGPCKSFLTLLKYSEANYVMFCDQDDVWLPHKIQFLLNIAKNEELKYNNKPLLVHSDLIVTDRNNSIISQSFWKYQNINPKRKKLNELLVQNNVTGCSLIINRKLADLVCTSDIGIIMHDWWIAIIAAALGEIIYTNNKTIMYRQHSNNDTGAHLFFSIKHMKTKLINRSLISSVIRTIEQAQIFLHLYSGFLNKQQVELISQYAKLPKVNIFKRILFLFSRKFYKDGLIRNIGFLLAVIFINSPRRRIQSEAKPR